MDYLIWNQLLYELTFSVGGEQELDELLKKAATAFLKKLDCAHVSILQYENKHLETLYAIPRVALKDPAYYKLVAEFEKRLAQRKNEEFIVLKKDLTYYGFPLPNFGLLLLGRNDPIEKIMLRELLPITGMLGQNCFFTLDTVRKRREMEAKLEKERRLLRVILDAIPDIIFYKDINGVYKVTNEATEIFLSLLPEDIIGHTDWDIHPVEEAGRSRMMDRKVMESGRPRRFEDQFKHRDGHMVQFEIIKVPVYDGEGKCTGIVGISRDITERKRYEQQLEYVGAHDQLTGLYNRRFLEEKIKQLDTLQKLPISIIVGDLNALKLTNDVFGHQKGDNLLVKAADIIRRTCRRGDLIARWGGDEFIVVLPQTDCETAGEISRRIKEKCHLQKNEPVQVSIALGWAAKNRPGEKIWKVIKKATDQMYSDKFLHAQDYKQSVIASLKAALFEKSMETEEHAERLEKICKEIGKIMGLGFRQLKNLGLLAMLHDIGKVAIRESILKKTGPLTEEEWTEMKKHPEIGYRFARAVPELSSIAEYILSHHEHWDGSGYPRGIKGEKIPLLSRILAVADAFDAMTNDRPYQKAITHQKALKVIKRNAGKQFDPQVVKAFCKLKIFADTGHPK